MTTLELLTQLQLWLDRDQRAALATVIKIYGSAPQPLGAKMGISSRGEMIGSVSGGCVEGAVAQTALELPTGATGQILDYGIGDEWAASVGLACGGQIQVLLEPVKPGILAALTRAVRDRALVALATVLTGEFQGHKFLVGEEGLVAGTLPDAQNGHVALRAAILMQLGDLADQQQSRRLTLAPPVVSGPELDLFVDMYVPPPTLIVVGAVHAAIPLVHYANSLGFHSVVMDARAAFATPERFPHADELLVGWPADLLAARRLDRATYLVVLTHDAKIDNPALAQALASPACYIGALGSSKTHAARVEALLDAGGDPAAMARIHAPIGLDLGGRTPEEIAVSIIGEMVAVKNGRARATDR